MDLAFRNKRFVSFHRNAFFHITFGNLQQFYKRPNTVNQAPPRFADYLSAPFSGQKYILILFKKIFNPYNLISFDFP